jgi:thermostable 8-oxoguanine DNA glycosylase
METKKAEEFIAQASSDKLSEYVSYFNSIGPDTHQEFFRRFLFAFASVHTTWESNVRIYSYLKDLSWLENKDLLGLLLKESRGGMHNNRTKYLWQFKQDFWEDKGPGWYYPTHAESWSEYRDRVERSLTGLGLAKTSFVCEMTWLGESDVVCMDVHMLRLYDIEQEGMSRDTYRRCEKHWVENCRAHDKSPAATRLLYWDQLQGQSSSEYWSKELEPCK